MTNEPDGPYMTSIAQAWQDFRMHCYRGVLRSDQERELRMVFYSGFYACLGVLRDLRHPQHDETQLVGYVKSLFNEYMDFVTDYLEQRQAEQ